MIPPIICPVTAGSLIICARRVNPTPATTSTARTSKVLEPVISAVSRLIQA
ncbi:MAG: hypothetical protein K8S56_09195 [Candidatus Cloacimonetes bacterium]|nr:hypothetical protein [Candidatus Cloacimonadota bacterium]